MILADTSIWIDHFKNNDQVLFGLLRTGRVLMHPFVVGELALGGLYKHPEGMRYVERLPLAVVANASEVLHLITTADLANTGIGYVDAHLVVSTLLTRGATLWTRDKRLHGTAAQLGIAANLSSEVQ